MSREPSKNRTKQREVSIERRPIISQEKPTVKRQEKTLSRRDISKEKNSSISDTRKISVAKKTPVTSEPSAKTSLSSKKTQQILTQAKSNSTRHTNEESKSKIKVRETKEKLKNEPTSSSRITKVSPREPESTRTRGRTTTRQPNLTEKLPNKTIRLENSSKNSVKPAQNRVTEEKKRLIGKKHERSRTRTLSPSEVKVLPVKEEKVKESNLKLRDGNAVKTEILAKNKSNNEENQNETEGEEDEDVDSTQNETETDYDDDFEVCLKLFRRV